MLRRAAGAVILVQSFKSHLPQFGLLRLRWNRLRELTHVFRRIALAVIYGIAVVLFAAVNPATAQQKSVGIAVITDGPHDRLEGRTDIYVR